MVVLFSVYTTKELDLIRGGGGVSLILIDIKCGTKCAIAMVFLK